VRRMISIGDQRGEEEVLYFLENELSARNQEMSGNDDSQFAAERVLLTAQFKAAVQTAIETIDANPNLNPVVDDTDVILRLLYLLEYEKTSVIKATFFNTFLIFF
jgi:hypothetical protein